MSYLIQRANYKPEYVYFIPTAGTDWVVESLAPDFSVQLSSEVDSDAILQAFLDNHAVLTVVADKASMQADGIDSVTFTINGQTTFDYRLMQGNLIKAEGTVNDGALEFVTDQPALYTVELKIGNQTGYAQLEAI